MGDSVKNVRFSYLYRDADNYKQGGAVVFSNPDGHPVGEAKRMFDGWMDGGEYFIADQVRVPEVFLWDPAADYDPNDPETYPDFVAMGGGAGHYAINDADHPWHEFEELEETDDEPTDAHGRTLREFVEEVSRAGQEGWREFDPKGRRTTAAA